MIKLPTKACDCKYHVECITYRCDVQHQQCCADLDELAAFLASNGFMWTGQRFYRDKRRPGECPLIVRVLNQSTQDWLDDDELKAFVLPRFFGAAEREESHCVLDV